MKISIKSVLIGGFLGLQVIPVSIILVSSYLTSQQVLLRHAKDIMGNIATFSIREAQAYLAPAEDAAQLTRRLANSEVVSSRDNALLEQYFFEQLALHPNFAGIYMGRPNGEFVYVSRMSTKVAGGFRTKLITKDGGERRTELIWKDRDQNELGRELAPNDRYDPRQRPWYVKAVESGTTAWTEPYIFFTSRKPGLTAASPARAPGGELLGVVGVDIEIEEISTFLAQLKVGKHGRAFIVNRNQDVVAFPDPAKIKRPTEDGGSWRLTKITELDDPLSRKAFESLDLTAEGLELEHPVFGSFDHQGRTYHTMFAPFSNRQWPWAIGIYVPEDDYLGPIKANRTQNIWLMVGIAALASGIGFTIARSVIRPMTAFREEALAVRDGDLETSRDKDTLIKEIQETADSFTEMKIGLREAQRRNVELTRGLERHAEELRLKELHLRATFSSLVNFSDALIVRDCDGTVRFVNPAAENLLGVGRAELLGHPFPHAVESAEVLELSRDGNTSPLLAEVRVVDTEWEGNPATLVSLQDVTERRRMEEEIRWRADTLEALHHVSLELAAQEDLQELLRTVAVHAARLLTAKGAAVFLHQEDGDCLEEAVRHNLGPPEAMLCLARGEGVSGRVLDSGHPLIVNDYANWEGRWTGHRAPHFNACMAAPIRWGGKTLGVLLVGDDQSRTFHQGDISVLERFTPLAAAALEQRRLLEKAESLYRQAQQDAETKSVLLQEVNHRVKNNLSAIIGLLYAERNHAAERDNPLYRATIQDLTSRMQGMAAVHDLLTASEWSPVPLHQLVRRIVDSALQALPTRVKVTVQVTDSPVHVIPSQASSLAIVIHELTMNAIKHAFADRTTGTLGAVITEDARGACVEFRDDGPGYPTDVVRLERHNMGLYLVQRIVTRDLDGSLELRNDGGAVATLCINLADGEEETKHG